MNTLKRWTSTIGASFDWVISQVENHEALVSSAIREMQVAGKKAKAQLARVNKDGTIMMKRLEELVEEEQTWAQRALRSHKEDKARALECVRRRKLVQKQISSLDQQLRQHKEFERQLSDDLKEIDNRILLLKRKKNEMSARQYRSEAVEAGRSENLGLVAELDEIFDRWESKLTQCEIQGEHYDSFETEFANEEEEAELEEDLADLIEQSGGLDKQS